MKTLTELSHEDCRWPVSELGGEHLFCAAPIAGKSYCLEHRLLAYRRGAPQPTNFRAFKSAVR